MLHWSYESKRSTRLLQREIFILAAGHFRRLDGFGQMVSEYSQTVWVYENCFGKGHEAISMSASGSSA